MAGTRSTKAIALGGEMRQVLKDAGFGIREVTERLGLKHPTVQRWLSGDRTPSEGDLAAFLQECRASAETRQRLIDMASDADSPHWLSIGMPEPQDQLAALLDIERTAKKITVFGGSLFPGLLQRGSYARAIMVRHGVPANQLDMRVATRVGRREVITERTDPLEYHAFISEAALHKGIGGPDIMREQLAFTLEIMQRDNVTVRVIPTKSNFHPGDMGAFTLATFGEERDPVVHLESLVSGLLLHVPAEVEVYTRAVPVLEEEAISPEETAELIASVINQ